MSKPRIVLAIPTLRPLKDGKLPPRVKTLAEDFASLVPTFEVTVSHCPAESEAHAVNLLIEEFRVDALNEWFVWWNIRVEMEATDLFTLINSGRAVIGALFTNCEKRAEWMASFYPGQQSDENGILPVAELGAGVRLFHRSVFDHLEKNNPNLSYIYDNSGKSASGFCSEALTDFGEYRRLLSPAYSLDKFLRESGIGSFANTGVILKHRDHFGALHPTKHIPKPWLFKQEPPPVIAESLPEVPRDERPLHVILQYCNKDSRQASKLSSFLRNTCGVNCVLHRSDVEGYPKGPNETALNYLRGPWIDGLKGVMLLEPDCVPVSKDAFEKLEADWDRAAAAGKLIMGSWHPINYSHAHLGHLNGNLIFHPDIAKRITIPDVPDDEPWDTYLADVFAPVWCRTGLIKNLNRHKTATLEQITTPECGTVAPAFIHGVIDESVWNYAKEKCK